MATARSRWSPLGAGFAAFVIGSAVVTGAHAASISISTIQQLDSIGVNPLMPLSGSYVLNNDIDASGFDFSPISGFTGSFNGNNFAITNLTINTAGYGGLFGEIDAGGKVSNLGLKNVNISGNGYIVGALAGSNLGSISNSYSSGSISIATPLNNFSFTAGLVGDNEGTIDHSHSSVSVSVTRNLPDTLFNFGGYDRLGGLVGSNGGFVSGNNAIISSSYSIGAVSYSSTALSESADFPIVGGLVGENAGFSTATILNSYSQSPVTVKLNAPSIVPGYGGYVGGLVGIMDGDLSTASSVYATGTVTYPNKQPDALTGGLIGATNPLSNIILQSAYWDTQTTGQAASAGGSSRTTAQLQSGTLPAGFDPTVWSATPGQYPTLTGVGDQSAPPAQAPPPDTLTLALMSSSAEHNGSTAISEYTLIQDKYGTSAFHAQVFQKGPQIVVAFQGTNLDLSTYAAIKTLLADDSFKIGSPSLQLRSEVAQAVQLVSDLHAEYPNASITLTGHSLGGAIAQLVGFASGFATNVFDAPGAGLLTTQLTAELQPVVGIGGASGLSTNYRLYGDQISLAGQPPGVTITVATDRQSETDRDPANEWPHNHDIQIVVNQLKTHAMQQIGYHGPTADRLQIVAAIASLVAQEDFFFDVFSDILYVIDPPPGSDFLLSESSGSPYLASLSLPPIAGIASYRMRYRTGFLWGFIYLTT